MAHIVSHSVSVLYEFSSSAHQKNVCLGLLSCPDTSKSACSALPRGMHRPGILRTPCRDHCRASLFRAVHGCRLLAAHENESCDPDLLWLVPRRWLQSGHHLCWGLRLVILFQIANSWSHLTVVSLHAERREWEMSVARSSADGGGGPRSALQQGRLVPST